MDQNQGYFWYTTADNGKGFEERSMTYDLKTYDLKMKKGRDKISVSIHMCTHKNEGELVLHHH